MKPRKLLIIGLLALAGCTSYSGVDLPTGEQRANFHYRPLSPAERESLRRSVSMTLKDPDAAQFKWIPVIADGPSGKPIGYCGLVNGKNSYGGYVGYTRFYAALKPNANGQYDSGATSHGLGKQYRRRCPEGHAAGALQTLGLRAGQFCRGRLRARVLISPAIMGAGEEERHDKPDL